jgi:hypothetical protein
MPPPMRYPERLLIRLPEGSRERIENLQEPDEQLADTQRRVILAGLDALEARPFQKSSQVPAARKRRASKGT